MRLYNVGIDLLKIISCAGVVFLHFGRGGKIFDLSVPIFMFASIFLTRKLILDGTVVELKKRIQRLYFPFACWGIIYFVVLCVMESKFNLFDLIMQMTIGVPANPPLYFMFLLMLNTALLYCVCHFSCWQRSLMVGALVLCILFQYSGINAHLVQGLPFHPQHSLGRFVELFPMAILAYLFSGCSAKGKWLWSIISLLLLISFRILGFRLACPGFSYQGIHLLLGAMTFFSLFVVLGEIVTGKIPDCILNKVRLFAGLTAGVYYTHLLIGKILEVPFGRHRGTWEAVIVLVTTSAVVYVVKKIKRLSWLVT